MRGARLPGPRGSARRSGGGGWSTSVIVVGLFVLLQLWVVTKGQPGLLTGGGSATAAGLLAAETRAFEAVGAVGLEVQRELDLAAAVVLPASQPSGVSATWGHTPPATVLPEPKALRVSPAPSPALLPGAFVYSPAPALAPPPPPFPAGERVVVAVRTSHFFGAYERVVPDCDVGCEFRGGEAEGADALWYHAPSACDRKPERAFPGQVAVVMSMESAAYYPCLKDPAYLAAFDLEMTYRLTSAIPLPYLREGHVADLLRPLLPFAEKRNEVIYIQSNCAALSGRDDILRRLVALGVTLTARGACLNNAPSLPHGESKRDAMRGSLFCATMENSLEPDYVSEKVWDGLAAGCLPIYFGAPNIKEHLPVPEAVVDYRALGESPEALATELKRLAGDPAAYAATMAWRTAPVDRLGQGYQRLVANALDKEHSQCRLCKLVSHMRAQRRREAAANGTAVAG